MAEQEQNNERQGAASKKLSFRILGSTKIFEKSERKRSKSSLCFMMVLLATGLPYYGHILGSTAKDVFGRYWTMKGRYVRRRWGWDYGLPTSSLLNKSLVFQEERNRKDWC